MCGIVGAIGDTNATKFLSGALKRLEYRGYDSAGMVVEHAGELHRHRATGKLKELGKLLKKSPLKGSAGIGHTRWATHGAVSEANAHPIMSADGSVAIVHNGIIENHHALKKALEKKGHIFSSDTDSEVLCYLFAEEIKKQKNFIDATQAVIKKIEGAYAFAVMSLAYEGQVAFARHASPLAVGLGDNNNACYIGSDALAMGEVSRKIIFLKDGDYGVIGGGGADLRDAEGKPAQREIITVAASPSLISKDGYSHFMEKEIREQPEAIAHTLGGMLEQSEALIKDIKGTKLKGMLMLAAGTSHNAALLGKYWLENLADLPTVTEIASEFRYRNPSMKHIDLAVGISQSGESLDTLMALREAARRGAKTLSIINTPQSTIARETDTAIITRAGTEIGVASTKTFTAQLVVLLALAMLLGKERKVLKQKEVERIETALESLPRLVGEALSCFDALDEVALWLSKARSCLFLGRGLLYPLALEGALKLKELSYIHAEGYASGEMKHGPIALVEEGLPIIALLADDAHLPKSLSNLAEAKARGAKVVILATEGVLKKHADSVASLGKVITVPKCDSLVAPIVLAVPAQILAYLTALRKGTDVDQPRNLAKSVTVE